MSWPSSLLDPLSGVDWPMTIVPCASACAAGSASPRAHSAVRSGRASVIMLSPSFFSVQYAQNVRVLRSELGNTSGGGCVPGGPGDSFTPEIDVTPSFRELSGSYLSPGASPEGPGAAIP